MVQQCRDQGSSKNPALETASCFWHGTGDPLAFGIPASAVAKFHVLPRSNIQEYMVTFSNLCEGCSQHVIKKSFHLLQV